MNENRRAGGHLLYVGDRVVNFRPIFFAALSFGLGIALSYIWGIYALFLNFAWGAAFFAALIYRFVKKGHILRFLIYAAVLCIVFSAGCLSFSAQVERFESAPAFEGECIVTGVVTDISQTEKTDALTFSEVTVITQQGRYLPVGHCVKVYVYGGSDLHLGTRARFTAELTMLDLHAYGRINASAMIENVRYRAFVAADSFVVLGEEGAGLFGSIDERVRTVLFDQMEENNASIAYAMLTGNSDLMDETVLQNFRYGGIAHIFAVSGLHIGVIYGLLAWGCKKIGLHRWVCVPVIAAVLVLYAGVCGFSPSSVRALVMCVVLMLMDAAGMAYDRLGSLSAAALVVMLVHPAYLFAVGFQLSVAAAAGIILLGGNITWLLRRIRIRRFRLPENFCSGIATALSAQLFTFPLLLDCFGYTSGLGLLLNIIFVPLISGVYLVLFVCTAAACLMPFAAAVILYLPDLLLRVCLLPIMAIEWKTLLICGFSFGGLAALWFFLWFLLSDKVNLKAVPKAALSVLLSAALVLCLIGRNAVFRYDAVLSVHCYYGSDILLLRQGGSVYLISSGEPDPAHVERLFLQEGVTELGGAIILAQETQANAALPVFLQYAKVSTLYVAGDSDLIDSFWTVDVLPQTGVFSFGQAQTVFLDEETLYLMLCGSSVLISCGALTEDRPPCDVFLARTDTGAAGAEQEIYFEKTSGKTSVYSAGDLQIAWKNGIITVEECR